MSALSNYLRRSIIKPTRAVKSNVRRTKQQNLDALVLSSDTLYASDMEKIGIARFDRAIEGSERRLKVKIMPITSRSWEIKPLTP